MPKDEKKNVFDAKFARDLTKFKVFQKQFENVAQTIYNFFKNQYN